MSSETASFPEFSVSHVGLFVFDIDRMVGFYTNTFGLLITDRAIVRGDKRIVFLSRDPNEHHQVVLVEGRTASLDSELLNQISLRVSDLKNLRNVEAIIRNSSEATDLQLTNHGTAFSLYFRDPERNRLEVFTDSPYYVEQAVHGELALDQSDEEILAETKSRHSNHPSFLAAEVWRERMRGRLNENRGFAES